MFKNNIGYYQKKAGLSNVELALKAGISLGHLVKLKNGSKRLNIDHLEVFSQILQCSPEDLIRPISDSIGGKNEVPSGVGNERILKPHNSGIVGQKDIPNTGGVVRGDFKKEARRIVNLMTVQTPFEHNVDFKQDLAIEVYEAMREQETIDIEIDFLDKLFDKVRETFQQVIR